MLDDIENTITMFLDDDDDGNGNGNGDNGDSDDDDDYSDDTAESD